MLRITVTLHYVTWAIQYLTVSVGIVAIRDVDQRVDIVLTSHMTE